MIKYLLMLCTVLLLSSCAAIFNSPYKKINIHSQREGTVYYNEGSVNIQNKKATIHVLRKKDSIQFSVFQDSLSQQYIVKKKLSFAFWSNLAIGYGAGMLVDLLHPKRFTYPGNIYLDSTETKKGYYSYEPKISKHSWELQFEIPILNLYNRKDHSGIKSTVAGFYGLGMGLNYYYRPNRYLNFSGHTYLLKNLPLPPPLIFYEDKHAREFSHQLSLSNNYRIQKFRLGYGLSYNFKELEYSIFHPDQNVNVDRVYATTRKPNLELGNVMETSIVPGTLEKFVNYRHQLGIWIPLSYELTNDLSANVNYRLSLFQLNKKQFVPESMFTFGITYRLKM